MSHPALPALPRDADVQRRIDLVRAERHGLARETRMLELALEELREEAAHADAEEAASRRATQEAERELLRCLLQHAVYATGLESVKDVFACESPIGCSQGASSAALCAVLEQYKAAQDDFTAEARRRLERLQAAAQTRAVGGAETVPACDAHGLDLSADNAGEEKASAVPETRELQALRCELDVLREMRCEVDEETDKTLLSVGRTLFA